MPPRQAHWWDREDSQSFGPLPDTVPTVRTRTAVILGEWGITGELASDVLTVVTELTTNAVAATLKWEPDTGIVVRLLANAAWLAAEVRDSVRLVPIVRDPDPATEGGRGLIVVNALSYTWGYWRPGDGGKVVYAIFAL